MCCSFRRRFFIFCSNDVYLLVRMTFFVFIRAKFFCSNKIYLPTCSSDVFVFVRTPFIYLFERLLCFLLEQVFIVFLFEWRFCICPNDINLLVRKTFVFFARASFCICSNDVCVFIWMTFSFSIKRCLCFCLVN
jgi:hypothetical protein